MEMDSKLFVDAFNKRIMLVSPTTLMMALRIIDNLWQVEKQNRNAQDIAQRAGALYDKLQGVSRKWTNSVNSWVLYRATIRSMAPCRWSRKPCRPSRKTQRTGCAGEESHRAAAGQFGGSRAGTEENT